VQTPPLPPPPGWQSSTAPPAPIEPHSVADPRPSWRRGHVGWSLLHLAIGFGIWLASLFVLGFVLAIAGRDNDDIDRIPDAVLGLLMPAAIVGWMCFAYLHTGLQRRWIVFGCVLGIPWVIAVIVSLTATD
jgi:hypothetical protein